MLEAWELSKWKGCFLKTKNKSAEQLQKEASMRYLYISCSLCMVYVCTIYAEVIYTNSWALYLGGTPEQINKIAKKHGFHILGKVKQLC